MSNKACAIMFSMIRNLCTCTHIYKEQFEDAYETAIKHYGHKVPEEPREDIVNEVIKIMNQHFA